MKVERGEKEGWGRGGGYNKGGKDEDKSAVARCSQESNMHIQFLHKRGNDDVFGRNKRRPCNHGTLRPTSDEKRNVSEEGTETKAN